MVVTLGPGRFYGSSLPRPRFLSGVKLNEERVDPPLAILDPLLSWAEEAHWSMGGLSFQRHRLQGRIEGSIKKLRVQRDRSLGVKKFAFKASLGKVESESSESSAEIASVTPLPPVKKKRARKLMDEFEMVAAEEEGGIGEDAEGVASRTRGARRSVGGDFVRRTSPRKMMS